VPTLANELLAAHHEYRLNALPKRLNALPKRRRSFGLVVSNEFRDFPFSTEGSRLFFRFFSKRYGRGSVLLTTTRAVARRTEVLGDERRPAALLDGLRESLRRRGVRG